MTAGREQLDPLVEHYLSASRSENTRRAYESDLRGFRKWGGMIPTDVTAVVRYVAHHAGTLRPSTLRRHLAAIASAHRDLGTNDPTKAPIVARVMHGIARSHGNKARQVAPLLLDDVAAIVSVLGAGPRDLRDKAMLLVGFFGALRRSEIVGLNRSSLRVDDGAATLVLKRSKTDQLGTGRIVHLGRRRDALCPVRALTEYVASDLRGGGPLFGSFGSDGRMSERAVARMIKRLVAKIGHDARKYSGHSLRAGFVTSASLSGFDCATISKQTGHRTMPALGAYIRAATFPGLPSPSLSTIRTNTRLDGN
jgi:site-specific recombinase XerD